MKKYRDSYFLQAKRENYPARSIYKLKEMDARFHLLKPGLRVLDLGAAPGSWSLGAAEKVGKTGLVLACDLQEANITFPPQVCFVREDVFNRSEKFQTLLLKTAPFDLVMSDMAPKTTGSRITDQVRSLNLALEAFELAIAHLKGGGNFVVKIFMGPDTDELMQPMRQAFETVRAFKPKSSRDESKETFYVALNFRAGAGETGR